METGKLQLLGMTLDELRTVAKEVGRWPIGSIRKE